MREGGRVLVEVVGSGMEGDRGGGGIWAGWLGMEKGLGFYLLQS